MVKGKGRVGNEKNKRERKDNTNSILFLVESTLVYLDSSRRRGQGLVTRLINLVRKHDGLLTIKAKVRGGVGRAEFNEVSSVVTMVINTKGS